MIVSSHHQAWQILTKVPKLTVYFWIIKIITTALGESTSDFMVNTISPYVAVMIGFIILVVALVWQFSVQRYVPIVYWCAALAVSIAGTMGADVVHVGFGVPYISSALLYLIALVLVFIYWYKSEHTLSIHSIHTRMREGFYWAAVLMTFALGTATGDLTAFTFHLGFLTSAILFIAIFAIPCVLYWVFRVNAIFTFWFAYIFTRPIGASFADWFGKSHVMGGLGFGDLTVSAILLTLFVILVLYISIFRKDLFVAKTT